MHATEGGLKGGQGVMGATGGAVWTELVSAVAGMVGRVEGRRDKIVTGHSTWGKRGEWAWNEPVFLTANLGAS